MTAAADLRVETEGFKQALRDYSTMTSQTAVKMLNGKCRDLMFRCYKKSPVGKSRAEIRSGINSIEGVAAYRLRSRYGNIPSRAALKRMMRSIGSGKGYAKSAWIKAANRIPKNEHSAFGTPPMSAAKFSGATAKVTAANLHSLTVYTVCGWLGINSKDRSVKQKVAEQTIASQMREASQDMYKRMEDKMRKHAEKVSAKRAT